MKRTLILPVAVSAILVGGATPILAAPPVVRTIVGGRLTINIGDDTSFQVFDSAVPPDAQTNALFSPPFCGSGDTADTGVLLSVGGIVYGPNFASHPCGTFAPAFTPWTPVSLSAVAGSGSPADPYTVVLVADAGATGLRLTETITHVAESGEFRPTLSITNTGAPATVDAYLATHMFLAIQYVYPILLHGAPGGWAAIKVGAPTPACAQEDYHALLPAADRYTGQSYSDMWNEIATGGLSNTIQGGCSFEGIATQWAARTVATGATQTLSPSGPVQFIRASPFQTATVPALSAKGLAVMVAGLAVVALFAIRAGRS